MLCARRISEYLGAFGIKELIHMSNRVINQGWNQKRVSSSEGDERASTVCNL